MNEDWKKAQEGQKKSLKNVPIFVQTNSNSTAVPVENSV